MSLTVKGAPINSRQVHIATLLLSVGHKLGAGSLASTSCMFDAIFESDVGVVNGWDASNTTYGGPLGGNVGYFGSYGDASSDAVAIQQAMSFFHGGRGYRLGGAIALARTTSDIAYIGSQVTAATPFDSQGYSTQYLDEDFSFADAIVEARALVGAFGGGVLKGGTAGGSTSAGDGAQKAGAQAGAGGSGTIVDGDPETTYAFSISGTDNPDEDYWTGINRLAQEVNWYLFSNGEYLYYLDGQEMLEQKPAGSIDRVDDAARFYQAQGSVTWDNTAYGYVSQHKRRFRTQRRTKVSIATSPTQGSFDLLCGIDEFLGGDVIELTGFGPADGRWIVAEARRSVFQPYTELTLQPALAPITEAIAAGTTGASPGTQTLTDVNKIAKQHGGNASNTNFGSIKVSPGVVPDTHVPQTSWNPEQKPIADWIIPILTWAAQHGWSGTVTSGYRTAAEQMQAATDYAHSLGEPISAIYPDGPLASNHCGATLPRGAVDVEGAPQLYDVLKGYPNTPNLVWAENTIEDGVHFSSDGH